MKNDNRNKVMSTPDTFVPVGYFIHPVSGDIYDLGSGDNYGKVIVKDTDRHPDAPPYTNDYGETFDVWTGELISRPQEAEEGERELRALHEAREAKRAIPSATKAADTLNEDEIIEANTDGEFTAQDLEDALESRTPAMQALLRARPQ